jgi:hypothetical protein
MLRNHRLASPGIRTVNSVRNNGVALLDCVDDPDVRAKHGMWRRQFVGGQHADRRPSSFEYAYLDFVADPNIQLRR